MNGPTRRRVLGAVAAGVPPILAGCLGDDDSNPPDGEGVEELPTPVLGDSDADVTVAVFADFACPSCRQFKEIVTPSVVENYVTSGEVRYEHRDFPLPVNEWSWHVGSAARAVQHEADVDAFWSFSTSIYAYQDDYSFDVIETVAGEITDVEAAVRTAAENETYRPVLETDRAYGEEHGVEATPTVLVDEELVPMEGETWEDVYTAVAEAIESRL